MKEIGDYQPFSDPQCISCQEAFLHTDLPSEVLASVIRRGESLSGNKGVRVGKWIIGDIYKHPHPSGTILQFIVLKCPRCIGVRYGDEDADS